MASHSIGDRIAIVGMGCTPFGDHADRGVEDLLVEASSEALASAGMDIGDVDAFWLGTFGSNVAGVTLSKPLKLQYKPVSRNENFCATGSDAFRNACYAVAAGAYDVAMAIGVEKVSDSLGAGIPFAPPQDSGTRLEVTPPGSYSYLSTGYIAKYGVSPEDLKAALTHVAWKNHANGARNARAQYRKALTKERIASAPDLAGNLSLLDCGGLTDGAAAVIICRAEEAHRYAKDAVYVKALSLAVGPGTGAMDSDYDYTSFPEVAASAQEAYRQAGVTDPRAQIGMAEVHDCFTVTEVVLMEDLQFAPRGTAWREILDGAFDIDGVLPVNPDGGLKSFGHPLGASGIRMLFESWLQLRGQAGERQIDLGGKLAMTQNLGGWPGDCLSFVSLLSAQPPSGG
ncbi:acetyl-CoA acetyltransferase [Conexibacter woesei]|uniref:Propanoyl-CoA C-acyltransferase n=1 Tax=Conexibacter woesei (strain DSM 14684 / CCUG 47730 / CIP 108061 / JCM 11494 / NBRC 100937 / ID131577) TaxID=469383 RepID=D3F4B0_CONWI|nr:acetyl-CoA acetyltransferase [Conexibacter woesei]ADB50482.1 Propanoyl-CoA C-acyltransferase [Conexibacter woesei DSM 14684]